MTSAEDYDNGNLHNTSTSTDEIIIPAGEDGIYIIDAGLSFASNTTGFRNARITINGVMENQGDQTKVQAVTVSGANTAINVGRQANLVGGDIIRLTVRQTSGGSLDVTRARIEAILIH